MHLISVNTGEAERLAAKSGRTGIFKRPRPGPVAVTAAGLDGDAICDRRHHGGPDQAVYVYGQPDYDWWSAALGRTLAPGTFGENLTIAGFESGAAHVGDRFEIGTVVLEVTSPRIPCVTLARRMDDRGFVKRFHAAARPGVYCRVIRAGRLQADVPVTLRPTGGVRIPIVELMQLDAAETLDDAAALRLLAAPIHGKLRAALQRPLGNRIGE